MFAVLTSVSQLACRAGNGVDIGSKLASNKIEVTLKLRCVSAERSDVGLKLVCCGSQLACRAGNGVDISSKLASNKN